MLHQITSAGILYEEPEYVTRQYNPEVTRVLTWFISADMSRKGWCLTRGVIFVSSLPVEPICETEVLCFRFMTKFMMERSFPVQRR